ncbi:MAG TPA: DNA polymerase III subunit gamma/tau [Clostridiaceae bacterium]|nr:DNA polymerase III subunit gamma/tau [Clostridiaceae bacterium]
MSYIALYREWRPKTFSSIVGQEHITQILKNQIKQQRIAHAYLFCGTRGTGKTSTAKVMAKAVNCLHPIDGEPCGECEICRGIDNGNMIDVIEIDAASNNGVDNIRELRDDVKYLPSKCKYKVYIIDEVHMLSTAAFNALLKTLEEPPAHIIFILATTEYQKVPATILSRCQRFDFKRISVPDIVSRLNTIAKQENVSIDDKTLNLIARSADGALRDALSVFDQCISIGNGSVTYEDVASMLGITTDEYLIKLADAVAENDASKCIILIDELINNGKDVYQFIKDFTMHFRDLLVCRIGGAAVDVLNISQETFDRIREQTKKFSTESIMRNINILSAAEADAKWVSQPRIILEMAVLKMCKKELDADLDSLLVRVAKLENIINSKGVNTVVNTVTQDNSDTVKDVAVKKEKPVKENKKPDVKKNKTVDNKQDNDQHFKDILKKWPDVINAINKEGHKILYSNIVQGKPAGLSDGALILEFKFGFVKKQVENSENKKIVEGYISSICGFDVRLHCKLVDEVAADKQQGDDIVKKAETIFGKDIIEVEE